ncbi:MAG: ShlB/FhaC/HecB family hemolysin secretion/activation protein [Candidatus Omnitrophica bacterium]|nr:ShlB/FhaC/HecB family hemolysin secretion/activation protein [Candidatus Omnitrophota bacterium]
MKKLTVFGVAFVLIVSLVCVAVSFAQTVPAGQTAGGVTEQQKIIEKEKKLEKKIEKARPEATESLTAEMVADTGPKVMIKTIKVEGATLMTQADIQAITSAYEGQELSLRGMQKVADLITDEYRKKGYATSRAYLPPQSVREGTLLVRVVEGKLGDLSIRGNEHFKTALIQKKIELTPGSYFDFSALQRSLVYINEHPDRKARATLVPGKTPGTTDVVIDVQDQVPFHVGLEYDNFASRYLDKDRYSVVLEHNNLFGFDDKAYLKLLTGNNDYLRQVQGRYTFPINDGFDIGGYFLISDTELGKEFADLDAEGKARLYGIFSSIALLNTERWDVRLTAGFDYKSIKNYLIGSQTSNDEVRLLKAGIDSDFTDNWGRTIMTGEIGQGIPDIMGGMDDKDSEASRTNSGGQFTKFNGYVFRLQALPYEMTLLWKNAFQYTNNNLVASEQFQAGGPVSVRGYAPAEYYGDRGLYTSPEVSFPIYFLPKQWTVFKQTESWYDTTRLVLFYDWAQVHLRNPQAGEQKHNKIDGWGYGLRFNLRDDVSFRVEVGYPLGHPNSSDGDHAHPWVEFTVKF